MNMFPLYSAEPQWLLLEAPKDVESIKEIVQKSDDAFIEKVSAYFKIFHGDEGMRHEKAKYFQTQFLENQQRNDFLKVYADWLLMQPVKMVMPKDVVLTWDLGRDITNELH